MQTDEVLALMQEVAAEVITPRFRALESSEIHEKNPGDLVTVADREAELILTEQLRRAYPDALIVGEEATVTDPDLLRRLAGAEHAWLIDPVDGTRNFVHGSSDHAVMLAEIVGGDTVRGWIWQPEHHLAFVAERGAGVERNGERLVRPEPPSEPAEMRGATSRGAIRKQVRVALPLVQETVWCCGVDYPMLAVGDLDYLVYGPPKPWDHAAGALMVDELGGTARMLDGSSYRATSHGHLLIAAASEHIFRTVHTNLG